MAHLNLKKLVAENLSGFVFMLVPCNFLTTVFFSGFLGTGVVSLTVVDTIYALSTCLFTVLGTVGCSSLFYLQEINIILGL